MGPDWEDVERRLLAMTVKQLRELGRTWFPGCLGGESTKRGITQEMVAQMRHWWTSCGDFGRGRVRNVMIALERMEAGR